MSEMAIGPHIGILSQDTDAKSNTDHQQPSNALKACTQTSPNQTPSDLDLSPSNTTTSFAHPLARVNFSTTDVISVTSPQLFATTPQHGPMATVDGNLSHQPATPIHISLPQQLPQPTSPSTTVPISQQHYGRELQQPKQQLATPNTGENNTDMTRGPQSSPHSQQQFLQGHQSLLSPYNTNNLPGSGFINIYGGQYNNLQDEDTSLPATQSISETYETTTTPIATIGTNPTVGITPGTLPTQKLISRTGGDVIAAVGPTKRPFSTFQHEIDPSTTTTETTTTTTTTTTILNYNPGEGESSTPSSNPTRNALPSQQLQPQRYQPQTHQQPLHQLQQFQQQLLLQQQQRNNNNNTNPLVRKTTTTNLKPNTGYNPNQSSTHQLQPNDYVSLTNHHPRTGAPTSINGTVLRSGDNSNPQSKENSDHDNTGTEVDDGYTFVDRATGTVKRSNTTTPTTLGYQPTTTLSSVNNNASSNNPLLPNTNNPLLKALQPSVLFGSPAAHTATANNLMPAPSSLGLGGIASLKSPTATVGSNTFQQILTPLGPTTGLNSFLFENSNSKNIGLLPVLPGSINIGPNLSNNTNGPRSTPLSNHSHLTSTSFNLHDNNNNNNNSSWTSTTPFLTNSTTHASTTPGLISNKGPLSLQPTIRHPFPSQQQSSIAQSIATGTLGSFTGALSTTNHHQSQINLGLKNPNNLGFASSMKVGSATSTGSTLSGVGSALGSLHNNLLLSTTLAGGNNGTTESGSSFHSVFPARPGSSTASGGHRSLNSNGIGAGLAGTSFIFPPHNSLSPYAHIPMAVVAAGNGKGPQNYNDYDNQQDSTASHLNSPTSQGEDYLPPSRLRSGMPSKDKYIPIDANSSGKDKPKRKQPSRKKPSPLQQEVWSPKSDKVYVDANGKVPPKHIPLQHVVCEACLIVLKPKDLPNHQRCHDLYKDETTQYHCHVCKMGFSTISGLNGHKSSRQTIHAKGKNSNKAKFD